MTRRDETDSGDEAQSSAPLPRRRHGLSIAVWVPALIGLTLVLVLGAFTSLGVAAPGQATNPPADTIRLL